MINIKDNFIIAAKYDDGFLTVTVSYKKSMEEAVDVEIK